MSGSRLGRRLGLDPQVGGPFTVNKLTKRANPRQPPAGIRPPAAASSGPPPAQRTPPA